MTAFSTLRSRAYNRLGITTASQAEQDLANEALNMALSYVAGKGASQLRQTFSGKTLAALSTTVSAHTGTSASITLSSVTGVYPGDIFTEATELNGSFLIRTVDGSVIDLGIQVAANINGNSVTVTRRTLPLPTAGTVWEIWEDGASMPLTYNPLVSPRRQAETGTAKEWTQGYSNTGGTAYISLFPAPSTATLFHIVMTPAFTEDSDVYMSEALLNLVLAKTYEYRMLMAGGQGGATEIAKQMDMMRQVAGAGPGVFTK